ncbi:heparan-alpha-glucosaminide N-acetyltransferase domain-containing protein [Singulisphaera sp. Ch08]|uniref:Heparan-alpha-glucosaminide N-acetyltransferase domain-containing protein n=1 Tax=Singulisphaera sp. Ch08 TaxID=3120278 RepID=A0AAU7CBC8_9BACT
MEATTIRPASAPAPSGSRIVSLDQFRGYTVVGMLFVNFLGNFEALPAIFKHHNSYCSYADTIMPQFFFAVGFAFRLTYLRRLETAGARAAMGAVLRRGLGLILLGFVIYHLDGRTSSWAELQALGLRGFVTTAFQRNLFQTLVHIALASIWCLPVIAAGRAVRVGFLIFSSVLHLGLSSWFYFDWVWNRPGIDGGPLGFLSWTIPLLVGSLAYDTMANGRAGKVARLAGWGVVMMAIGYGISCMGGTLAAPPFVAPSQSVTLWTMSQRSGSLSYLTFASGFSLALYALFVVVCDRDGLQLRMFSVFGRNALAAYILHPLVAGAMKQYMPHDAPAWYVAAGFGIYFWINYLFINYLDRSGLHLRL